MGDGVSELRPPVVTAPLRVVPIILGWESGGAREGEPPRPLEEEYEAGELPRLPESMGEASRLTGESW